MRETLLFLAFFFASHSASAICPTFGLPNGSEIVELQTTEGQICIQMLPDDAPQTVADGLKVSLRPATWHFVENYLSDVLLATEQEFKVVESSIVTEDELTKILNEMTSQGWNFDGFQFAMRIIVIERRACGISQSDCHGLVAGFERTRHAGQCAAGAD